MLLCFVLSHRLQLGVQKLPLTTVIPFYRRWLPISRTLMSTTSASRLRVLIAVIRAHVVALKLICFSIFLCYLYRATRMHSANYAVADVCSFVRLSVTCRYSVETARHIVKLFYRKVCTTFKFFRTKRYGSNSTRTSLTGAPSARGMKKSQFSTNISLYLTNDTRYGSYYGMRIGNLT